MKDKIIQSLIQKEEKRQREGIELIPSENHASSSVRKVLSSVFINKYSEGYPKKRYYGGNEYVDEVEMLAQERAKKLFHVPFVNVQPYSGSPANLAVYLAVCHSGDTVMGQALIAGGHLTHGHTVSATGIFYKTVQYGLKINPQSKSLNPKQIQNQKFKIQNKKSLGHLNFENSNLFCASLKNDLFDYEQIRKLTKRYRPKLIWVGATAYPLQFNYDKFSAIADEVDAYLCADIAHVAGLIVGGVHPSPVKHVHIVTTTTHKTLRGPRGAMIMVTEKGLKKDPDLPDKINKAVFPGLQGGPHDNQTAAIAVCLYEASQSSFKQYAAQVVKNALLLAEVLSKGGLQLVGAGTENHLILVDLTPTLGKGAGVLVQKALDLVGLTVNKNTIPDESSSPFYPSGIRLGTPAATTRGMKEKEMRFIGSTILEVVNLIEPYTLPEKKEEKRVYIGSFEKKMKENEKLISLRKQVKDLAIGFPLP